jgi:cellulose biosynthesis protein BcsQ
MTPSLLFGNTKGGTGKSLITLIFAHAIIRLLGIPVFLLDIDHQGTLSNLTLKGRYKEEEGKDMSTYLKALKPLTKDSFIPTDISGLFFIPNYGDIDSDFFISSVRKGFQLDALKIIMQDFNEVGIVLYDIPGSNGNNFLNVLKVVENVIIPIRLSAEDIDPIKELIEYIEINKISNAKLKIQGVLINQFDKSATSHNQRELERLQIKAKQLPIFKNRINHSIQYPTASGLNLTIFEYLKENEQNFVNSEEVSKEIITKLSLDNYAKNFTTATI